ncbi:RagB/SusD family nutrient uptake outer membrane protein [Lacihabitans soyangensis]|uniref:RagB/SusD family nutrient uptake outer membrane protein n=1 Tax=Lacihabitans soyangensis TaxID=869394 RepID=A0AAE3H9E3_9BACT|nr:RagB/SusD family nutrient uptake outer membrane protein [Lacihabitans soyangensis]MCP9766170.1 RagB/SusD family nutrient uptake outer membrane protein [Lacihabitans soyangensis]
MKKVIIFSLIFSLVNFSCSDSLLTITPEVNLSTNTFFKTDSDFIQAVNAAYAPQRAIHNITSVYLTEQHSDNARYVRNVLFGATENQSNLADFNVPTANGLTTNTNVLGFYRQSYLVIARANQVLSLIDEAAITESVKKNVKGQALFLRAITYLDLVRLFNRAPLQLKPVTGREDAAAPLGTADQIYTQIIKDAAEAATLLPDKNTQTPGRATSGAAQMVLANVYIIQKKWAEAETELRKIVSGGQYSLMPNYSDAFTTTNGLKNGKESIFEIQYLEGAAGLQGNFFYNMTPRPISGPELATLTGTSNAQALTGDGNNVPTPDLVEAYEVGDKRKEASIGFITIASAVHANKSFPYMKKFARPHSLHDNHGMNWPVYRYSEALLFLAEALVEQNKLGEATTFINQIRSRAGLEATKATSQTDLRNAVYQERRVELAFESKRLYDLVRTGRFDSVIKAYGEKVKADKFRYYFPAEGFVPSDAFTNITPYYGLPADEAALSPHF